MANWTNGPKGGEARRPDPDALLELAGRDRRGKLTIFLGAAPGVGKTYAMLARAQRLKAEGAEIVVGLVETHGRSETATLLDGLEILPRRPTERDGAAYDEFDLDGALARRPKILLVDELAHTNPLGSRHPKRYGDIAELIAAGIDVWTALNIQHLESLSDLVATITGVVVREIVPDSVLKSADDVILVDIPPADLIARLNEGKIYLPASARRAADGFFKPANLTALRELALRRAADRVDDQMVDFLRQSALEGPWATGERLLVCVGPDALSEKVVRTASRLASGLNARWLVVSLSRPGDERAAGRNAARLDETLRLAERLGAEVRRVPTDDFVGEVLRIARRENITQIVLGRPRTRSWTQALSPSLPDAMVRQAGAIGVYLVPGDGEAHSPRALLSLRPRTLPQWLKLVAVPVVSVSAVTAIGTAISALLALQNLSMLYLAAVLISAVASGQLAALLAAGLSFLAYNFFFISPNYTLTVAQPHEVLALTIFLGVAIVVGNLAARLREQVARSRRQARMTQALYEFSRRLSGAYGLESVLTATATHLQSRFGLGAILFTPDEDGQLRQQVAWPPDLALDNTDMVAARWAYDKKEPAGFMTGTLPQVPYGFWPIVSAQRIVGVVGLAMTPRRDRFTPEEEVALAAILDQAAIAIDRGRLVRENTRAALDRESEKLQVALLSSLSHDLRTPMASITGAVSSLRELGDKLSPATRDDLLASIEEETGRLNRFVSNLFAMTRIEARTLKIKPLPLDLATTIAHAVQRARAVYPALLVETSLAQDLAMAQGDESLLEQVLFNLLDNAFKYGDPSVPVAIFARSDRREAVISVTDGGKGIPSDELEKIFDKFYRRAKGDGRAAGTGLGLSIARGFINAMGGSIKAESPAIRRRGTRFIIRLPLAPSANPPSDTP